MKSDGVDEALMAKKRVHSIAHEEPRHSESPPPLKSAHFSGRSDAALRVGLGGAVA